MTENVLTPVGAAPEFTKSQTKSDRFPHVSKTWTDQCISYDEVMEQIETARRSREDIEGTFGSMTPIVSNGRMVFKYVDGREFVPTDHALSQYATFMKLSTTIVRELRQNYTLNAKKEVVRDEKDAEMLVNLLENARRHVDLSIMRKFRTYSDGTMRAFLSDQYAYIDNRWYLDCLHEIIPDGLFSHWRGDEDKFDGNILIPETIMDRPDGDSDYGGMISAANNEIGSGKNEQMPSLFRAICLNGMIHKQTKGEVRAKVHKGEIDFTSLKHDIYDNITKQIPLFTVRIEQFLATRSFETGSHNMTNVIGSIAQSNKLSKEEAQQVLVEFNEYESAHRNLFGVINAITRAGQKGRVRELDTIGGSLVSMSRSDWENVLKRGDTLKSEEIQKIFGLSV